MSGPAVQLTGVGKDYPLFSLRDISLEILRGEIAGFIGPNGAGKSTTIRIIMGLIYQDRGDVRVLGHEMPADPSFAIRPAVGEDDRLRRDQFADLLIDELRFQKLHLVFRGLRERERRARVHLARLLPRGTRPPRALRSVRSPRAAPSSRTARRRSFDVTPLKGRPVTLANGDCADLATSLTAYTRPS